MSSITFPFGTTNWRTKCSSTWTYARYSSLSLHSILYIYTEVARVVGLWAKWLYWIIFKNSLSEAHYRVLCSLNGRDYTYRTCLWDHLVKQHCHFYDICTINKGIALHQEQRGFPCQTQVWFVTSLSPCNAWGCFLSSLIVSSAFLPPYLIFSPFSSLSSLLLYTAWSIDPLNHILELELEFLFTIHSHKNKTSDSGDQKSAVLMNYLCDTCGVG